MLNHKNVFPFAVAISMVASALLGESAQIALEKIGVMAILWVLYNTLVDFIAVVREEVKNGQTNGRGSDTDRT